MLELNDFGLTSIRSDTVVMNKGGYWQLRGDMGSFEVAVSVDSPGKKLLGEKGEEIDKVTVRIGKEKKKIGMMIRFITGIIWIPWWSCLSEIQVLLMMIMRSKT